MTTIRNGGFDLGYKAFGLGFESAQEKWPTGRVIETTKRSISLFGFTFERTSGSDGSYTNELKYGGSWFRSAMIGVKGEANVSLIKEGYRPNK